MTRRRERPAPARRVCKSDHPARIATAEELHPKPEPWGLTLGANGAQRVTPSASTLTTEICIAFDKGMCSWRYRSSSRAFTMTVVAPNGEVESLPIGARLATRAHAVFQRPRRTPAYPARPPPAIVRPQRAH